MGMKPRYQLYLVELEYPEDFPDGDFPETPDLIFVGHATTMLGAVTRAKETACDMFNRVVDEEDWYVLGVGILHRCSGCGGLKKKISPAGHGAVGEVMGWV